jgi:Flp pilus assembly pilin Flp
MDPYGETGQSTIEWLALMAMLVALAGVLVATVPSISDVIVGAFEKVINAVTG